MINQISLIKYKQLCRLGSTNYELKHRIHSYENINNVHGYFQNTNDNSEHINDNILINPLKTNILQVNNE